MEQTQLAPIELGSTSRDAAPGAEAAAELEDV
ncbi:MAG: hypothetical protein QOK49_1714 [Baekduia sp.]|nr:hypothetical protein [Baekduia sp.]